MTITLSSEPGPVPGLYVDDYDQALERLASHKIEWLTETETAKGRRWRHYRAPDGNVYEVMGPIDPDHLCASERLVRKPHSSPTPAHPCSRICV